MTIASIARRPLVRPWALAAPIVVLILCIPMLRPLRHPSDLSPDETLRLATVRSLLDHRSLALDVAPASVPRDLLGKMIIAHGKLYSEQPPAMALLLAAVAWVLAKCHLSIEHDPSTAAYVLTLLCVTLPVALAAGMVYRMGRVLELPRYWRSALALITVVASGLISYAVVLNEHAPAAALLLVSAAMLMQVEAGPTPPPTIWRAAWIVASGIAASAAVVLDPPALIAALFILAAVPATSFSRRLRFVGPLLFLIGAAPPVYLHAIWNVPVTGNLLPGNFHHELAAVSIYEVRAPGAPVRLAAVSSEVDVDEGPGTFWQSAGTTVAWLGEALVGSHGLLSHFPFVIFGVAGVLAIVRRHWPAHIKFLAVGSLLAAVVTVAGYCWARADWGAAMFASQWFVCFLPLLTFWSGAWIRRPHGRWLWFLAGLLLAYSSTMALVGLARSPDRADRPDRPPAGPVLAVEFAAIAPVAGAGSAGV